MEIGDRVGGFFTHGKIKTVDWLAGGSKKNHCVNDDQIKERANYEWSSQFQGMFKELIVKKDGLVFAHHSNYDVMKGGRRVFKKKKK